MKPKISAHEVLKILNEKYPIPDNPELDDSLMDIAIIKLRSKLIKELEKEFEVDYGEEI